MIPMNYVGISHNLLYLNFLVQNYGLKIIDTWSFRNFIIISNYFTGKLKQILLYQGFPRPILHTKYPERREGC